MNNRHLFSRLVLIEEFEDIEDIAFDDIIGTFCINMFANSGHYNVVFQFKDRRELDWEI